MEQLVHVAREDAQALDRFVAQQGLQAKETGWLFETEAKKEEVTGKLAEQLFSPQKRQRMLGYFAHGDFFVLYQPQGVEKSFTPPLAQVRDDVVGDYYAEQADTLARSTLKNMRARLLAKKATLEEIAREGGSKVVITQKTDPQKPIAELGKEGAALSGRFFALTDPTQVLEVDEPHVLRLVMLHGMSPIAGTTFESEAEKIIKQEKYKENTRCLTAFIASMYRNAKIETDPEIMKLRHIEVDTTSED